MKTEKTCKTKLTSKDKPATRQMGFRLRIDLADEIRRLADADERDVTWVLVKVVEIGLPIFRERRKAA